MEVSRLVEDGKLGFDGFRGYGSDLLGEND